MGPYKIVFFLAALYFLFIGVLFLIHSDYSALKNSQGLRLTVSTPLINVVEVFTDPFTKEKQNKPKPENLQKQLSNLSGTYSVVILTGNLGEVVVIKPNQKYYAASLYKVPVAVATKKYLEDIDKSTETYKNINNQLTPLLKNSDNGSQSILINTVGTSSVQNAIGGLGLNINGDFYQKNIATPMEITTMFANLDGTNYILKQDQEEIINLMYQTSFDDRISDHLKDGLEYSHKIGNWGNTGTWHDCGIVTGDLKLYVCLMSEQTTFEEFLKAGKYVAEFINQL